MALLRLPRPLGLDSDGSNHPLMSPGPLGSNGFGHAHVLPAASSSPSQSTFSTSTKGYYKTAARELGITVATVSFHLKNIYAKLQVHSKSAAVAKALRERLV